MKEGGRVWLCTRYVTHCREADNMSASDQDPPTKRAEEVGGEGQTVSAADTSRLSPTSRAALHAMIEAYDRAREAEREFRERERTSDRSPRRRRRVRVAADAERRSKQTR